MRVMRTLTAILLTSTILIALWQCSSATSGKAKQDSTAVAVKDSVVTEAPVQPVAVVDNRTLKEKLDEIFASGYPSGLDSTQHMKLVIQTSYNDYEGQSQGWHAELYFDKSFSPKFFRELHRYGYSIFPSEAGWYFDRAFTPEYYKDESDTDESPSRPEIKEYVIAGDSIVSTHEETSFYNDLKSGRSVITWNAREGGVKSSWSYDSSVLLNVPVESNYKKDLIEEWSYTMQELKKVLKKGSVMDEDDDILFVQLTKTKENNDLLDSTNVIIPRVLYNRLRKSKQ
jgi:hypothetical protein